ncbi:MAG: hypothetical protein HY696_01265 [Deltaproteobacteria bacterium]|nr:hypothetical protein [Deltaproteobacteria bacterium]
MMRYWLCGALVVGLLSGCENATTVGGSNSGGSMPQPTVATGQTVEKYVEPGESITVDPPSVPGCQNTEWKAQGPYETQYGVSVVQQSDRRLTVLTGQQPQDYDLEYEWNCEAAPSSMLLPYRVRIHAAHTFFPRRENQQWTYAVQGAGSTLHTPTFTNQTRSQGELMSSFSANGGTVSFRVYLNNGIVGNALTVASLSYQFYRSGIDGDAKLAFDPPIALLDHVRTPTTGSRIEKTIVSFTTDTEISGWAPFAGTKELTVMSETTAVTLADGAHDGLRVTLADADGREYLPPMVLVKGKGIVAQQLHDVFVQYLAKYLGTTEIPQMTLVSNGP